MIRKENVNIVEMNRKMISASTLKPSLDAFPIKDISVPFNSTRNMEINNPESLLGNDIGIANKIAEIKNNKVDLNAEKNENIQLNIVDLENEYKFLKISLGNNEKKLPSITVRAPNSYFSLIFL